MNFLNSALFTSLAALLALPLVLHLLNRRMPVKFPFPDIGLIRRSFAGRSRLARWRHLVLLLVRTAVLALLLLAFLLPVLPRLGSEHRLGKGGAARRVLLIADHSLSMEYKGGAQPSAASRLVLEAGKILSALAPGDRVNAIVAEVQPSLLLPEFSTAHDRLRTAVAALPPATGRADHAKALALAATALGESAEGSEVYILSDFQRGGWADVSFEAVSKGTRLFFVDCSGGRRERANTAILRASPASSVTSLREPVSLEVTAANYSPDPVELPLEAIVDGGPTTPAKISLAPWSTGKVTLELAAPGPGAHGIEVRSPEDGLPLDNHRWTQLEVRDREEVLVLSDAAGNGDGEGGGGGLKFILAALDPFDGQGGAFTVRQAPAAEVTPRQLSSASRVVLSGIRRLSPDLAARLAGFLAQGGGVLWFLDGEGGADTASLEALDTAAGGGFIPFQVAGRLTAENFGGVPQKMARGQFDSRFLRLFRGAGRQSLGLLEFYSIQRALPTGHGRVLLNYADGTPAMGASENGLGTAVLCNFAPAELASNMARQRLFPAWMQDMVKALRPEAAPDELTETGGTLTAELWLNDLGNSPFLGPDNRAVAAKTTVDGARVSATLPATLPGLYTQGPPGGRNWMGVVNVPAEESDLRGIDPEEIRRRSVTGAGVPGAFLSGARDYAELNTGRPVFHWFVLAAAALTALEMLLLRPLQKAAGHPAP